VKKTLPGRRVLLIDSVSEVGGAERVLLGLLRDLDSSRWGSALCLLAPPGALSAEAAAYGPVTHHPTGRYRNLLGVGRAVVECRAEIGRTRADVVHTNGVKAHVVGGLAAAFRRRRCVWHVHDILDPRTVLVGLALRIPATLLVATSHAVRARLEHLGVEAARIRVVHPGLDLERFDEAKRRGSGAAVRQELSIPPDAPIVSMIGRLQPWKGQHIFLAAASQVVERFPTTRFLLVGDAQFGLHAEYPERLRRLATALQIDEHVHFLGQRADVPRIMDASTVIVHASVLPEAFGLVVLEAMAAGRPVVATRAGGPCELIDDGVTGVLVPPGQPGPLADALIALLADPPWCQNLGAAARAKAAQGFAAEATARGIQDAWDEALRLPLPGVTARRRSGMRTGCLRVTEGAR
jgi:glycosyltransferase involved in cell wall biosynthesis